jgi:hypothetical protein
MDSQLLLPIITAYSEGKQIQLYNPEYEKWVDINEPLFTASPGRYRVKPSSRSFNSQKECWQYMQEHQPFGWIMLNDCPTFVSKVTVFGIVTATRTLSFEDAFKSSKFMDGTSFGIEKISLNKKR